MALSSISAALAQYATACEGAGWQASQAAAQSALEAVRFLAMQRAEDMEDQGSKMTYASVLTEKKALELFLGVGSARANGRTRRVGVAFVDGGVQ